HPTLFRCMPATRVHHPGVGGRGTLPLCVVEPPEELIRCAALDRGVFFAVLAAEGLHESASFYGAGLEKLAIGDKPDDGRLRRCSQEQADEIGPTVAR